ncbi:MAG: DUF4177 domain-containing protein, partial [Paracoccaceae bacterium]
PSRRGSGGRGAEAFARTVEAAIGEEAVDGWEFQRAESLPCEERAGWFGGRRTEWRTVLVFRRPRAGAAVPAPETAPRRAESPPDPDEAAGRAFARGAPPRPSDGAEPALRSEPALRLSPAPDPDPDRRLHPDPDAPRLGPAER